MSAASFLMSLRVSVKEARGAGRVLFSFALALILGVSAMVLARGLSATLEQGIEQESKRLLGADILLTSRDPIPDGVVADVRGRAEELTTEVRLRTMARTPEGASHIVQLSAIEGNFPFYGELETTPPHAWKIVQNSSAPTVLVHASLADKLGLSTSTPLFIGTYETTIAGIITKIPGDTSATYAFAPRVIVAAAHLPKDDLLSRGALADYYLHLKLRPDQDPTQFLSSIDALLKEHRIESETVEDRQRVLGEVSSNIGAYFSLAGTIALLLGTLNALLSLQLYLRQKRSVVAVLKCLGASEAQIVAIFGVQVLILSLVVSLIGACAGGLLVPLLPSLIQRFAPFSLSPVFPGSEVLLGIVVGILPLAILLFPTLRELSRAQPLEVLRPAELSRVNPGNSWRILLVGALLIVALAILGSSQLIRGALMGGGVLVSFIVVAIFGRILRAALRSFRLPTMPLPFRYALANVDRPGNQSLLLLICFGIGAMLLSLTFVARHLLDGQTALARSDQKTNTYLFDVQTDQVEPLGRTLLERGFKVTQQVPVVLMRLVRVGDKDVRELLEDPDQKIPKWTLNREYWSTYRAHQTAGEKIVEGNWIERVGNASGAIPVSIEDRLAERLGVKLGDELGFDVSGLALTARITSIRDILWERLERNSFLVFPEGVFEHAPRFYVLSLSTPSSAATSELSKSVAALAPNVSVLDVRSVVDTVEEILSHITLVLRLVALLILLVALSMLTGVLIAGQKEREREGILLKIIGAKNRFVTQVVLYEYVILAACGTFLGVALASIGGLPLAYYVFKTPYSLPVLQLLLIPCGAVVLVGAICVGTSHRTGRGYK